MRPWRKICCPVDFSDVSRPALQQASQLASVFDGELTLVHVWEAPAPTSTDSFIAGPVLFERTAPELERRLLGWASEVRVSREVKTVVLGGTPAQEIVRFASE